MSSKRHFALFLLFLSSTYAKELTNLGEGQDLPLDKNDEIADLKVHLRQNQEDLQILRLDMNRQEYLLQVLNDNVEKQNKELKADLQNLNDKNTEQLKDVYTQLEKLFKIDGYTMDPSTGNRYKVIKDKKRTWMDAKSLCQQDGAELASIRNSLEWQYVKGIMTSSGVTGNVWLGGSDSTTEDTWVWTDGSSVTYTDWSPGQPGGGTSYNCLGVNRGYNWQWFDFPCNWPTTYAVCKIPA